jgi:hypothetical protein
MNQNLVDSALNKYKDLSVSRDAAYSNDDGLRGLAQNSTQLDIGYKRQSAESEQSSQLRLASATGGEPLRIVDHGVPHHDGLGQEP